LLVDNLPRLLNHFLFLLSVLDASGEDIILLNQEDLERSPETVVDVELTVLSQVCFFLLTIVDQFGIFLMEGKYFLRSRNNHTVV
jgi:hypothetical protein